MSRNDKTKKSSEDKPQPNWGGNRRLKEGRRIRRRRASKEAKARTSEVMKGKPKFEGDCDDLKGFVYDCSTYKQTEQYIETTEKITTYVGSNYKNGQDIRRVIENLERPVIPEVEDIDFATASGAEKAKWDGKLKAYLRRVEALDQNMGNLYSLILGQCTKAMKTQLTADSEWSDIAANQDPIRLLKLLKDINYHFESKKFKAHALIEAYKRFYSQWQGRNMALDDYHDQFNNHVEVIEHCGGILAADPSLLKEQLEAAGVRPETASDEENEAACKAAEEAFLATAFILFADRNRYGKLVEDLENSYSMGSGTYNTSKYPKDLNAAYNMLLNWKQDPKHIMKLLKPGQESVAFAQKEDRKPSGGHKKKKPVKCFGCGAEGKYRDTCDICNKKGKEDKKGETNAIMADGESQECIFVEGDEHQQNDTDDEETFQGVIFMQEGKEEIKQEVKIEEEYTLQGREQELLEMATNWQRSTTSDRVIFRTIGTGLMHPGEDATQTGMSMDVEETGENNTSSPLESNEGWTYPRKKEGEKEIWELEPMLKPAQCLSCGSRGEQGTWCRTPYCQGYYSAILGMCQMCESIGVLGMPCNRDNRNCLDSLQVYHPLSSTEIEERGITMIEDGDWAENRETHLNMLQKSLENAKSVREENQVQKELQKSYSEQMSDYDPRKNEGGWLFRNNKGWDEQASMSPPTEGRYKRKWNPLEAYPKDDDDADASDTSRDKEGTVLAQMEYGEMSLNRDRVGPKRDDCILLDTGSTVDVFRNPKLLNNVKKSESKMTISCNAGKVVTDMKGELSGYGDVWYSPKAIANVLSFSNVKAKYRVEWSDKDRAFIVHGKGGIHYFRETLDGLYMKDCTKSTMLMNTVHKNSISMGAKSYRYATRARKLQNKTGLSTANFIRVIEGNLIPNCPVTRRHILDAELIFGPSVSNLQGKTVRRRPKAVEIELIPVPEEILKRYREVILCIDVMFLNELPFLVTLSVDLYFGTGQLLLRNNDPHIVDGMKKVRSVYKARGFNVTVVKADRQFESIRPQLADMGMTLNTVAAGEHVPEIERYIRTVKERCRCKFNMLPFKKHPTRMNAENVYDSISWLNAFPPRNYIHPVYSPRVLLTGIQVDYKKHCLLEFGAYVHVHEETNNTMRARTIAALALRPTGNWQGGYYFLSLSTGKRITRRRWTELPMSDTAIAQVHNLARRSRCRQGINFFARDGTTPILDLEIEDDGYEPAGVIEDIQDDETEDNASTASEETDDEEEDDSDFYPSDSDDSYSSYPDDNDDDSFL